MLSRFIYTAALPYVVIIILLILLVDIKALRLETHCVRTHLRLEHGVFADFELYTIALRSVATEICELPLQVNCHDYIWGGNQLENWGDPLKTHF